MRTFGTILALLLIFFGLVVAGLVIVRIWQGTGQVRMDINTASVSASPTAANEAADGAAQQAANAQEQPLVVGVESGGMALAAQGTAVQGGAAAPAAPADEPAPTIAPLPTVDPCPPALADGFAADTAVVVVGNLRVYSQADVTSQALRELGVGQGLWIVAGEDGSTAIKRCEVIWQRVRTADGLVGWVLKDAVDVAQATIQPALQQSAQVTMPVAAPAAVVVTRSPCVGGCPTPCTQPCPTPCYQPCPTPCYQPCAAPPCTTPCGVYR